MATGNYGIKRPADVSPTDMEMFLHYTPSRDSNFTDSFTKLDPSANITQFTTPSNTGTSGIGILEGMYNLNLDPQIFSSRGIYTIYIRPRQIIKEIVDNGRV